MRLTHFSKTPISVIEPRDQAMAKRHGYNFKPTGLWYSVDGDWERWCVSDWMTGVAGKLCYELTLGDENILRLQSISEILRFHDEYHEILEGCTLVGYPNWARVAEKYDCIEIAPYCWELRCDLTWYYPWDCASGCIWQPRGATLALTEARLPVLEESE